MIARPHSLQTDLRAAPLMCRGCCAVSAAPGTPQRHSATLVDCRLPGVVGRMIGQITRSLFVRRGAGAPPVRRTRSEKGKVGFGHLAQVQSDAVMANSPIREPSCRL